MLAVGLGVDYAPADGEPVPGGAGGHAGRADRGAPATVATAGRTVLFAGLTVAVALCGLLVFPDPFLRSMGLAGAAVVAVDMLAALTLLPALLVLLGRRIPPATAPHRRGVFARVARAVQRRPRADPGRRRSACSRRWPFRRCDLRLGVRGPAAAADQHPDPADVGRAGHALPGARPARTPSWWWPPPPPTDPELARLRDRVAAVPGVTRVEVAPVAPALTVLRAAPEHLRRPTRRREAVARSGRCRRRSRWR